MKGDLTVDELIDHKKEVENNIAKFIMSQFDLMIHRTGVVPTGLDLEFTTHSANGKIDGYLLTECSLVINLGD